MIFQGITPILWGTLAEVYGRRPVYLTSLAFVVSTSVGLALVPTPKYWLLVLLRCISSSGGAVVIPLGSGIVSDIAATSERGMFMGMVNLGPMLGPCLGPVIGGFIDRYLGWRAVFWFLSIFTACCLVLHFWFLPETLRTIRGNGSIPSSGISMTLLDMCRKICRGGKEEPWTELMLAAEHERKMFVEQKKTVHLLRTLHYFFEKDVSILLFFNGVNFMNMYIVTATTATIMQDTYGLGPSDAGLCYLPFGTGMAVGSVIAGRLIDRDFHSTLASYMRDRRYDREEHLPNSLRDIKNGKKSLSEEEMLRFPLEHARLKSSPIYDLVLWSCIVAYGWSVHFKVHLAVPLIFQFFQGLGQVASSQSITVLLMDLYPGEGASIAANIYLTRSLIGAIAIAIIDPLRRAVGMGPAMMVIVSVPLCLLPLMFLERRRGMRWRQKRAARGATANCSDPAQNNIPDISGRTTPIQG
ncbi:major facilitator superfamily domain-containing protein [Cantharellus anzutake]|uniref:major facilitator superfamily domain-containing protein n=1 Tax=Cantharellus anzutake TaxID=1750568 RepID=UPI001906B2AA|nr:major facilitator superfamily domain-containing protein [Cantharellus anzutake]KAF8314597.1 major facilitator superfamily domain-containing protein [Cantharellus anzutake]